MFPIRRLVHVTHFIVNIKTHLNRAGRRTKPFEANVALKCIIDAVGINDTSELSQSATSFILICDLYESRVEAGESLNLSNSIFICLKIRVDVHLTLSYRYLLHIKDRTGRNQRSILQQFVV